VQLSVSVGVADAAVEDGRGLDVVGDGSLHPPNHPGSLHVEVEVRVGLGAALGVDMELGEVVLVVLSLQPNHPGVLQVDVDELAVVVVDVLEIVVDSSKHPHQPGVLHVSVRVRVVLVEVALAVLDVVVLGSLLLLSKNFQSRQSWHSVSSSHLGTVSYFSSTSLMTLTILCVPIPTLHPRSFTVSYMQVWPVWHNPSNA